MVAEDITQSVFLKLLENFNKLQNTESANYWIFKTARNEFYDYYNRNKRSSELSETLISTEKDEFEQLNIQKAVEWTLKNKFKVERILTEEFINRLHKRMYGDLWKWAGEFRSTNKNIGVRT